MMNWCATSLGAALPERKQIHIGHPGLARDLAKLDHYLLLAKYMNAPALTGLTSVLVKERVSTLAR